MSGPVKRFFDTMGIKINIFESKPKIQPYDENHRLRNLIIDKIIELAAKASRDGMPHAYDNEIRMLEDLLK